MLARPLRCSPAGRPRKRHPTPLMDSHPEAVLPTDVGLQTPMERVAQLIEEVLAPRATAFGRQVGIVDQHRRLSRVAAPAAVRRGEEGGVAGLGLDEDEVEGGDGDGRVGVAAGRLAAEDEAAGDLPGAGAGGG